MILKAIPCYDRYRKIIINEGISLINLIISVSHLLAETSRVSYIILPLVCCLTVMVFSRGTTVSKGLPQLLN